MGILSWLRITACKYEGILSFWSSARFQMVSLLKLAKVTEEGVRFLSPHDGTPMWVVSGIHADKEPLITDSS